MEVTIGCFYETQINLDILPYNDVYAFAIAIPYAGVDDFMWTHNFKFDTFITEVTDCFASILTLCGNVECTTLLESDTFYLIQNPI